MILVKNHIAESKLQGTGLFTDDYIKKGELVICMDIDQIIPETLYLEEHNQRKLTSCRLIGDLWFDIKRDKNKLENEDYINHSFTPNLLYHVGKCFALRNVVQGEELTVNYQYILSNSELDWFIDVTTNREVIGFSNGESYRRAGTEFLVLVQETYSSSTKDVKVKDVISSFIK